jgi:hypothetical protein
MACNRDIFTFMYPRLKGGVVVHYFNCLSDNMLSDVVFKGLHFAKFDAVIVWSYLFGDLLRLTYS